MKKSILKTTALIGAAMLLACGFASAQSADSGSLLKRKGVEETILDSLRKARPDINFGQPRPSPIKGLYQVQVAGGPLLYVTPEGDKLIAGDLLAVGEGGFERVEDPYQLQARKDMIATIDPKSTINFAPKGKPKAIVYVFTDVDCGYCRRLHGQMHTYTENGQQLPGYNDLGIEIRYLAYPRAGIPSPSADKLIAAWCAKDQQEAMTRLKAQQPVANTSCDNPVAKHFQLGGEAGVSGTPALFFSDGRLLPGYLPPADLAKQLGI